MKTDINLCDFGLGQNSLICYHSSDNKKKLDKMDFIETVFQGHQENEEKIHKIENICKS